MKEYIVSFKYGGDPFTRNVQANSEDEASSIAYARTKGMLGEFDEANITKLYVELVKRPKKSRFDTLVVPAPRPQVAPVNWQVEEAPVAAPVWIRTTQEPAWQVIRTPQSAEMYAHYQEQLNRATQQAHAPTVAPVEYYQNAQWYGNQGPRAG